MKRWEYLTKIGRVDEGSDSTLNKLGAQGWELVSHTVMSTMGMVSHYYTFKRELHV